MIGRAREKDGMYHPEASSNPSRIENNLPRLFIFEIVSNKAKIWLHHCRLGHSSFSVLKILFLLLFKGIDVESLHCDICEFSKYHCVPLLISNNRTFVPFSLIHSYIWGPSTIPNVFGARWFVSFIKDCTRVTWPYLMRQKSDVNIVFLMFHSIVKNHFGVAIKRFRSDNARGYFNKVLSPQFQKKKII